MAPRRSSLFDGVDPRLVAAIKRASANSPYEVEITSGYRPGDPRQHGKGNAIDMQLIDRKTGERLPNYQDPKNTAAYQKFAHTVYEDAQKNDPELAKKMRWGGYFGLDQATGKPKYGTFDLMHLDTAGHIGTAGGSWEKGFTPQMQQYWKVPAMAGGVAPSGTPGGWPIARAPAKNIPQAGAMAYNDDANLNLSRNPLATLPVRQASMEAPVPPASAAAAAPPTIPEATPASVTPPGAPVSPIMSRIDAGHSSFDGKEASPMSRINQGFGAAAGKPISPMERISGGHEQFSSRPMLGATTSPPPGASPPPYPNPRPQDPPLQVQTRDVPPEELPKPPSAELAGAPGSKVEPPAEPVPAPVAAKPPEVPPADKKKKETPAESIGGALEDIGKSMFTNANTAAARASGPTTIPMPMSTPLSPMPMVDPKRAEMQRQMLAMAMQRLNSGKLF